MADERSKVFLFNDSDPAVRAANEKARANFRYFWRELAWEYRRILPGLSVATIKAPFRDLEPDRTSGDPNVEHMWVGDVNYDGRHIAGRLLNKPNWLKSHHEGDEVSLTVEEISDWMYVWAGEVYGAYTVQLMRSRMNPQELQAHDAAWGLNFGKAGVVRVRQAPRKKGVVNSPLDAAEEDLSAEHPMAVNCAPSIRKQLESDPSLARTRDDRGWTQLHHFALAGSRLCVQALLDFGADRAAKTDHGITALDLARSLGWEDVAAALLLGQGKGR
ncbi:MAG: hypothetical protein JWP03_1334 [Phycisphaerales bacterium]|jgi:uncharacterized protein YegJ (DUF2314 family)|nr:hypothetical protein [Phycisphaerales bacterium]